MSDNTYITFTNTIDDMVAFNMHHIAHSPAARSIRFWSTWGLALIAIAIGGVLSLLRMSVWPVVFILLWSTFYLAFVIPYHRWAIRRRVGKLVREGKNRGFLCEHTLRLTDEGIHSISELSESRLLWLGIERIAENDDYLFIYVGSANGAVVPKGRIDAGDLQAFTDELRRRVDQY